MCIQLQQENANAITYAAKYSEYRQEMFLLSQRNEEVLMKLQQDLRMLNSEAGEDEDEEVSSCVSKAMSLAQQLDEDMDDEEIKAVLRNSKHLSMSETSGFSGQSIFEEADSSINKRRIDSSSYSAQFLPQKREKLKNESVASSSSLNEGERMEPN
jgi:hypothetical protein